MARPTCSIFIAISLDGFIARSDGAIDWLSVVERAGEDYGFRAFYDTVDTLVMGRKTYETALGFDAWPYAGKRCVVLTHQELSAQHGERGFSAEPAALVEQLHSEGARRVYVDGGNVIGQFLSAGLIDDVTVSIIPVLLGKGLPLTPGLGHDVRLVLAEQRAFESGLVQLCYRVEPDKS